MTTPEHDGQPMTPREIRIARAAYEHGLTEALPFGVTIDEYLDGRYPLPETDDDQS